MQAGGGLVEDVQGAAGVASRQLLGQLHPLRFAAGQSGRALAELDVAQAHVDQGLELARDRRHRFEQLQRLLDGHLQHVVDAVALVQDVQGLAVVALAVAHVAGHVHVGQEVHLDLDQAIALAGLAAAAAHVEAEAARRVAACARLGHLRIQFAQGREQAGIGGRIGTRGAPDRRLVDVDHLVEQVQALDLAVRRGLVRGTVDLVGGQRVQGVVDQGRLARTGHAGDAGHQPGGDLQVHVLEVVARGAAQAEGHLRVGLVALVGHLDHAPARQVLAGDRARGLEDVGQAALADDLATVHAGTGADVQDVVGGADRVLVVFDHNHRVAQVAQAGEGAQQALVVALVQADGWFVEYVHHPDQAGADLAGQADALGLAAGQGVGLALQGQVVQAHVDQEAQPLVDLLDDPGRDLAAPARQLQAAEERQRLVHRQHHQ